MRVFTHTTLLVLILAQLMIACAPIPAQGSSISQNDLVSTEVAAIFTSTAVAAATQAALPTATPTPAPKTYLFGNPAGCAPHAPTKGGIEAMLAAVQKDLGREYILSQRRQATIYSGPRGTEVDVSEDPYVYEFVFDEFMPSQTYRADEPVTIFLNHGFAVWLRWYGGHFRLTAFPLVDGILQSEWAPYVSNYWKLDSQLQDNTVYNAMRKLPCRWMIDKGYAREEDLALLFDFSWQIPDFVSAGSRYLAINCREAYRISQEEIGYWDASSMCGPLSWQILYDANAFPYRIGDWYRGHDAFVNSNPKVNAQPWVTFDPGTFDIIRVGQAMAYYDFDQGAQLYPGDVVYAYTPPELNTPNSEYFDHIFLVAGVRGDGARMAISNMVQNYPSEDCFIQNVALYIPGNLEEGVIRREWNGGGYGITGSDGFDIFRWNWTIYHIGGQPWNYTVRWGDTLETIGFDWKIDPASIAAGNGLPLDAQLSPGQVVVLPAPPPNPAFSN